MPGEGYQFVNMLLNKQARQADIDIENQRLRQQQMQNMMQSAGQLAGSLKASKQDGIANALMNKSDAPRAEAVNPNAPGVASANAVYGGASQPHSGGMDELKLSMAMDANKNKSIASNLAVIREARMQQQQDDAYNYRQQQQANAAARATNQKTKDMVTASSAYFKNMGVLRKKLGEAQTAGDFDTYNSVAQDMQALHYGSVSAGVKLPDLNIPDFRQTGPDAPSESDLSGAMSRWEKSRATAMAPGGWDSNGRWLNGKTAGEEYMDDSNTLSELQEQSRTRPVDKYTPPVEEAAPTSQPSGNSAVVAQAKQAIASGANPQAVSARLKSMGIDPAILTR